MMKFFTTTLAALAMALTTTTSAAPVETPDLSTQSTGAATWYKTGLGSCGWQNNDGELVVALAASRHDREHPCGRRVRVSYQGRSVDVEVVDKCMGCADSDIDLSPAAFKSVIGDLGIGRTTVSWDYI